MAHARTESVTAASLFGDEPVSNDFFASLAGGEDQQPREMVQDRHFSQQGLAATHLPTQNDASDLFSDSTIGHDANTSWMEHPSHASGAQAPDVAHETASYDYGTQAPAASQQDSYANQGWYDEYNQWHSYDDYQPDQQWTAQQGACPLRTFCGPTFSTDGAISLFVPIDDVPSCPDHTHDQTVQDSTYGNGTYDYSHTGYNQNGAAPANYVPSVPTTANHYGSIGSSQFQQPYDPYKPAVSQAYAPTTHTSSVSASTIHDPYAQPNTYPSSQQVYDPYKPNASNVAPPAVPNPSTATYPAQSFSYATPQPPVIPAPPKPLAGINRATSYNAYDPPVLDKPRKGSRIVSASSAIAPSPTSHYPAFVGQQAQAPVVSHLPPPPPRSPYYGQSAQPIAPVFQQAGPAPPAPAPPPAARAQSPPQRSYDPYAPNGANAHTPPRAQPAAKQQYSHPPISQAPSSAYGTSQDTSWDPSYSNAPQQSYGTAPSWAGHGYDATASTAYQVHHMDREPYSGETVMPRDEHTAPGYAYQSPVIPPAPSTNRSESVVSLSTPPPDSSAPSQATSAYSPPSSLNGMSPNLPSQPPPVKPPQRNATPASVRSFAGSPDYSTRSSIEQMRGSPRPDVQAAQTYPSTTSSPAAHLELARSRIASPVTGVKPVQKTVTTNGAVSRGEYDLYSPVRTGSLPNSVDSYPAPVLGGAPRAASPYGGDHSQYDPYSPQAHSAHRRQTTSGSDHAPERKTTYDNGYSNGNASLYDAPRASIDSARSLHSTYTPSTTQTGGDDFLGRTSSRAPIIAFGFGGKVVSVFPKQADAAAGFDVSMISRKPPPIAIRPLKQFMNGDEVTFPGPLFADPGTPTVNITRTAAATVKANKMAVLKYLHARAEIVEKEIGQLPAIERPKASGKLSLILLLKIMVEHDGKLSGRSVLRVPMIQLLTPVEIAPRLSKKSVLLLSLV